MKQKRNTTDSEYQEFVEQIFEEAQRIPRAPIRSWMYRLEGYTAWDWVGILVEKYEISYLRGLVDPVSLIAKKIAGVENYNYWNSLRDMFQPESPRISSIALDAWLEEKPDTEPVKSQERLSQTTTWQKMRKMILEEIHCCQECGSKEKLHVCHIRFGPLGYFERENLIVLCRKCHYLNLIKRKPLLHVKDDWWPR